MTIPGPLERRRLRLAAKGGTVVDPLARAELDRRIMRQIRSKGRRKLDTPLELRLRRMRTRARTLTRLHKLARKVGPE